MPAPVVRRTPFAMLDHVHPDEVKGGIRANIDLRGDHRRRPGRPAARPPPGARPGSRSRSSRRRSREHVLGRIRAGVLEQGSVDILAEHGLDADLRDRGLTHHGIYLQFEGQRHHVDFVDLVGRTVTVYGQQALVRAPARRARRGSAPTSAVRGEASVEPERRRRVRARRVIYAKDGVDRRTRRATSSSAPTATTASAAAASRGRLEVFERSYPFGWLGILADVPPSTDDLIYALHRRRLRHALDAFARGLAPLPAGGPRRVDRRLERRAHLGCAADGGSASTAGTLHEGRGDREVDHPDAQLRRLDDAHGRMFLAGDAGHIVPPTGAKGLNSAIADVALLGRGDPRPPAPATTRASSATATGLSRASGRCSTSRSG